MSEIVRLGKGYLVLIDGYPFPKSLPGRLCLFRLRRDAKAFADAVEQNAMRTCHRLIETRGRWYVADQAGAEDPAKPQKAGDH